MDDNTSITPAQGAPPAAPPAAQTPSPFPPPKAPAPAAQPQSPPGPGLPPLPDGSDPDPAQAASAAAQNQPSQSQADLSKYDITSSAPYFLNGGFDSDIREFSKYANSRTGYQQLDMIQPFYPGLYCIGAISSLGKTTFASQLADQAAALGQKVMYFSLEQDKFELFSKSIARGFFRTDQINSRKHGVNSNDPGLPGGWPLPSSIDIRRGAAGRVWPNELRAESDAYVSAVGNRITVVNGTFSVTVEEIAYLVKDYIKRTGDKPLVVIDYLQVIQPTLVNGRVPDTKTSIDHIVQSLKILQKQLELTMLVISSLNRQNYLTPIDFESFKESGGIEYTFDCVWGLQLALLDETRFYFNIKEDGSLGMQTSLKQKREMVNEAKRASPRKIQFVCLKNRFGVSNYKAGFLYYPASDFFMEPVNLNESSTWVVPLKDIHANYTAKTQVRMALTLAAREKEREAREAEAAEAAEEQAGNQTCDDAAAGVPDNAAPESRDAAPGDDPDGPGEPDPNDLDY